MKKIIIVIALLSLGPFLWTGTAAAAPTSISGSLTDPAGILDQLFGLGNLQRVDDALDQVWFPANGSTTVIAKFAGYTQEFGYIPDLNNPGFSDDSFMWLLTVPGGTNGIGLGGPSATLTSGNVNFLWALDPSGAPLWTSLESQNSDGLDHMTTWLITGGSGNTPGNWVIAWEDLPGSLADGSDRDFNDLVLEVSIRPVPIPAAIYLLGAGFVGLVGLRRKLKK
jgi:uncharacterized protein DUF4114